MDHYEVRNYPGWHHHMLTTMLAHFFLWHVKRRLGKQSAGSYDVPIAGVIERGLTPTTPDDRRGPGVGGVGAAAQSPGISIAASAAARGRIEREVRVFYPTKIIFVVKTYFSPFALSGSNYLNFKLPVESSPQSQPL